MASQLYHNHEMLELLQNIPDLTWTPGIPDVFKGKTHDQIMNTISPISTQQHIETESKYTKVSVQSAPQNFSWVNARPDCFVESYRQTMTFSCYAGLCGSSPVMTAQAFSDNRCIFGKDIKRKVYNAQYMAICSQYDSSDAKRSSYYIFEHGIPDETCYIDKNLQQYYCPSQCDDKSEIRLVNSSDIIQIDNKFESVLKYEISVDIQVYKDFMFYVEGIYKHVVSDKNPLKGQITVTVVGYGEEKGIKYWIIRSAYGSVWGETGNLNGFHRVGNNGGYMRIARGTNECNIDNIVGYVAAP
ncbi:Cathepsin_B [Hexamita inflata]|uniref:Cathepsin B n=1 Tax=Hexamita inflata TaxID=28002 RepID=A0AA86NI74_9EUKA|nr:Cathepsin B [Hexamita inflata]